MEIEFYVKKGNTYELKVIDLDKIKNVSFIERLFLTLKSEIKNINLDFEKYNVNKKRPSHSDYTINKKVKLLAKIKKVNLNLLDVIRATRNNFKYIICNNCGQKMYLKPIGVNFEKINNTYIIKDDKQPDYWIYSCENCHKFEREGDIELQRNLTKYRNELLSEGYNWVPNNFGTWYHYGNKPLNKHPNFINKNIGVWKRNIEEIKIKGQSPFIKITETNTETGEIKTIK